MKTRSIKKFLVYSALIVAPGGIIVLAGYHLFMALKSRQKGGIDAIQDNQGESEDSEAQS